MTTMRVRALLLSEQRHSREDMAALRADVRADRERCRAADVLAACFSFALPLPSARHHMEGQPSPQQQQQQSVQAEHQREPCGAAQEELEFRAVD